MIAQLSVLAHSLYHEHMAIPEQRKSSYTAPLSAIVDPRVTIYDSAIAMPCYHVVSQLIKELLP